MRAQFINFEITLNGHDKLNLTVEISCKDELNEKLALEVKKKSR